MVGIITQDDLVQVPTMLNAMARYVYGEMQSSGPIEPIREIQFSPITLFPGAIP